jgi:hypothetical protein
MICTAKGGDASRKSALNVRSLITGVNYEDYSNYNGPFDAMVIKLIF